MIREYHTPTGTVTKELTTEEINALAQEGDAEAIREVCRELYLSATTQTERTQAIAKALQLIPL